MPCLVVIAVDEKSAASHWQLLTLTCPFLEAGDQKLRSYFGQQTFVYAVCNYEVFAYQNSFASILDSHRKHQY